MYRSMQHEEKEQKQTYYTKPNKPQDFTDPPNAFIDQMNKIGLRRKKIECDESDTTKSNTPDHDPGL